MKKTIITISSFLIVGFLTASAYAWNCGGMYGYGDYDGANYHNGSYQSFNDDTQALRSSIAADRAELNALMAGTNPDSKRARKLSKEISKSENELRNKAKAQNVSAMGMTGYGQGWDCGISGHNHNFAGCW